MKWYTYTGLAFCGLLIFAAVLDNAMGGQCLRDDLDPSLRVQICN